MSRMPWLFHKVAPATLPAVVGAPSPAHPALKRTFDETERLKRGNSSMSTSR